MEREGLSSFGLTHEQRALDPAFAPCAREIDAWRSILRDTGLVGQDPGRYGGHGFGNLSLRVSATPGPAAHQPPFLVTGTQTGHLPHLALRDFCLVVGWDLFGHAVRTLGETPPSSEALTHAALYELSPAIHAVLHVHSPEIWQGRQALGLPESDRCATYGSAELAREASRVLGQSDFACAQLMALGGHVDGLICVGPTLEQAGVALVALLARARCAASEPTAR